MVRLAMPAGQVVRAAALGNGQTGLPSTEEAAQNISQEYINASMALAAKGASTIVLPEEIALLKPQWQSETEGFARVARSTGSRFVVGYREIADASRNIALTFSRGGITRYAKRHLIPGLEPLTPGQDPGLLGGSRAVAICKDMDFGDTIRNDAQHGIRILFVPAWDFGEDGEAHANIAIMRGVENGFALVRAARNGLLTITDAEGRVLARASASSASITSITADLPLGAGPTLYTHIGDVFAWLCIALTIAMAGVSLCLPLTAWNSFAWNGARTSMTSRRAILTVLDKRPRP
jgi:apolipoprotein N-acyltransferase